MSKFDYESFVGPDQAIYGPHGSQVTYNTGILGGIVTIANGLFAAVMITIMIRGAASHPADARNGGAQPAC